MNLDKPQPTTDQFVPGEVPELTYKELREIQANVGELAVGIVTSEDPSQPEELRPHSLDSEISSSRGRVRPRTITVQGRTGKDLGKFEEISKVETRTSKRLLHPEVKIISKPGVIVQETVHGDGSKSRKTINLHDGDGTITHERVKPGQAGKPETVINRRVSKREDGETAQMPKSAWQTSLYGKFAEMLSVQEAQIRDRRATSRKNK